MQEVVTNTKGFYSNMFMVPKKDGGQRPVINLKHLNRFVKSEHFKMEGLHTVKAPIQEHDWMAKIDLKNAFFMVPITQQHQHLLHSGDKDIPVQVSPIRPVHITQSVHQNPETNNRALEVE